MGHHHSHHHHNQKNILVVFILNLLFVIIEVIGAILSQSISLASDSLHDFGDCLILLFAYFLDKYASKKSNDTYTYGFKKLSIIASIFTSLVLIIGSSFMIIRAVKRIQNPEIVDGNIMLIIAIIGITINTIGALQLKGSNKLVTRAIMLHLIEDILSWVAILISSIFIIKFKWFILDPILSICISLFVLYNALKNSIESISLLLDKAPDLIDTNEIKNIFLNHIEIDKITTFHLWSLDEDTVNLTVTCIVNPNLTIKETNKIKQNLIKQLLDYNLNEIIIEFI